MKRIISILLACTILSSLAACQGKADVVKNDRLKSDDIKSENTTDTVDTTIFMSESDAESSTDVPIETSLADIGKKIILDYCDKTEIIYRQKDFPNTKSKNESYGIIDYYYIGWLGCWDREDGDSYFMSYSCILLEFDVESDIYKSLKVGDQVSYVFTKDTVIHSSVSAINGKYVLCLTGSNEKERYEESLPDYTIGNLQDIYQTFIDFK